MSTQPEALRLADYIDQPLNNPNDVADAVSAELRFLHAENEALRRERDEARRTVRAAHEAGTRLTAQRDALLEALKKAEENGCATVYANEGDEYGERGCCGVVSYMPHADDCWVTMSRAAIKAAEEGK